MPLTALVETSTCKDDKSFKPTCSKLRLLKMELGRSRRKKELEDIGTAGATAKKTPAAAVADPGAANLGTYLSALGLTVSPEVVSRWLSLIPTLAIELGSALSVVLVGAISAPTRDIPAQPKDNSCQRKDNSAQLPGSKETAKFNGIERLIQMSQLAMSPGNSAPAQPNSNIIPYVARSNAHTRQSAEEEILRQLKLHRSSAVFGAQRQMAFSLGIDRSM
jgi:hypothetical protein